MVYPWKHRRLDELQRADELLQKPNSTSAIHIEPLWS